MRPTLHKGSVSYYDNPSLRQYFLINPDTMTDSQSAEWSRTAVPGSSHPVYQYGATGSRTIAFKLILDGDRLSSFKNTGLVTAFSTGLPGLDVAPHMRFWRSMIYPQGMDGSTARAADSRNNALLQQNGPRKVVLNYGTFWQDVVCVPVSVGIVANFFTPKLEVVRAILNIVMEEAPDFPVYANEVRQAGGGSLF